MNAVLNFSDQIFTGTKWNSFTDFSSVIPVFTQWRFDLSTLEIFPAFKNHITTYLYFQRLHKWIILKEHTQHVVPTSGFSYGSTSTQPDHPPAPSTPSLATWWVGLQGRYLGFWTVGAFLMQTKTPKSQMAHFPKLQGFFAQLAFPGGLSSDIFFTNYQNKHFLFYFSLLLLSFGVLFHGKIQNWRALFQTGIAWNFKILLRMEDLPSLKASIYSRLPFLQSERGQIILWLCALMCF